MQEIGTNLGNLYLKPAVMVEPLINHWHAWPYLVAPHTAAMVSANTHLRLLDSYIKAPELHARAAKDPMLFGGTFLDYSGDITNVRRHAESMRQQLGPALQFAEAVKAANTLLAASANGAPLDGLYRKLPERLRGFVELGYDLQNQPSIRFIEPLLYRSENYRVHQQTLMLATAAVDERPFVLSTPRYAEMDKLELPLAFECESADTLARMRLEARPTEYVMDDLLGKVERSKLRGVLAAFFTMQRPKCDVEISRACVEDELRIDYLGHATLLIRCSGISVLIDPLIPYPIGSPSMPRWSYCDLPEKIDYVLLTHSHQDHVVLETLLQLRHRVDTVVVPRASGGQLHDPSLKIMLQTLNFRSVKEFDEFETISAAPDVEIVGLPFQGEHGDIHVRSKLTYAVNFQGRVNLFVSDSRSLDPALLSKMSDWIGAIEGLFLGMECEGAPMSWLYGPLLTSTLERRMDQARRLDASDCAQAQEMIQEFGPRRVFIYAMGSEPWVSHLSSLRYGPDSKQISEAQKLIKWGNDQGIPCKLLSGAQSLELSGPQSDHRASFAAAGRRRR